MNNYIGVKLIQAEQMDELKFALEFRGGVGSVEANKAVPPRNGYKVVYPDGYVSWSPAGEFEKAYLPLDNPDRITLPDLRLLTAVVTADNLDPKTTLVKRELVTGFVQYETSSCVDPKNYDPALGADLAIKKMDTGLWFAMGFVLQWAKYGLQNTRKI